MVDMAKKKILVIEDNTLNLKLVRSLLMLEDYQVVEADNAETGIELAKEQQPDLILMDIQLPGMDGLSATRELKTDPEVKGIPVIALTAHAMLGDEQKALEAGCVGYIPKPLDTKEFPNIISRFLG
jgi:CheY-like chemotaxis protein